MSCLLFRRSVCMSTSAAAILVLLLVADGKGAVIDLGAWVWGEVGFQAGGAPDFVRGTAEGSLALSYQPPSGAVGNFPDCDMEGFAGPGTVKAYAHTDYTAQAGLTFYNVSSGVEAKYRELLTVDAGPAYNGTDATYALVFHLTGTGSATGYIDRRVEYSAEVLSNGHYFEWGGGEGSTQTGTACTFFYSTSNVASYDSTFTVSVQGVKLGDPVDLQVKLFASVSKFVMGTFLPQSGAGTMDFLHTGAMESVSVKDLSGNVLATFDSSGTQTGGTVTMSLSQVVPEPASLALLALGMLPLLRRRLHR